MAADKKNYQSVLGALVDYGTLASIINKLNRVLIATEVKLTRFRGHPNFGIFGVHDGKKAPTLCAGVPAADDRAGSSRSHAGGTG